MTDNIVDRIKTFRTDIEKRKQLRAKREGEYDAAMKRLKDDYGLESMEAAEAELESLRAAVEAKDVEIAKLGTELDSMMEATG